VPGLVRRKSFMVRFMASFMAMMDHAMDVEPRRHPNHPNPDRL
jgi:hypothetical protein